MKKQARLIGEAYGCEVTFENYNAANVQVNDAAATEFVQSVARELPGDCNVITDDSPQLGGEDFADFSEVVPSCFVQVGTRKDEATAYTVHNGHFNLDEDQLKVMVQLHVDVALKAHRF